MGPSASRPSSLQPETQAAVQRTRRHLDALGPPPARRPVSWSPRGRRERASGGQQRQATEAPAGALTGSRARRPEPHLHAARDNMVDAARRPLRARVATPRRPATMRSCPGLRRKDTTAAAPPPARPAAPPLARPAAPPSCARRSQLGGSGVRGPGVGPARAPGRAQARKRGPAVSPAAARAAGSALRLRASVRVAKGRAAVFPPPGPRKRWYGSGFRPREGTAQRGPRMGDLAPAGVPGNCPRLRSCSFPDAAGVGWGRVGVASGSRALRPEGRVVFLGAASERSREPTRPRRKAGPGPGTVVGPVPLQLLPGVSVLSE